MRGAAGGQDQIDVGVVHQRVGQLQRRGVDPADDVGRGAGGDGGVQHQLGGGAGRARRARMRAEDDAVAGLQADQRLEDRGRGRVGGRHDAADQPDRLGDGHDAGFVVDLDDAAGLVVLVGVVDVFRGEVVLDHLVLDDAHAGFFGGHLRQRNTGVGGGQRGAAEDQVHLFLRVGSEDQLRGFDARDQLVEVGQGRIGQDREGHSETAIMIARTWGYRTGELPQGYYSFR